MKDGSYESDLEWRALFIEADSDPFIPFLHSQNLQHPPCCQWGLCSACAAFALQAYQSSVKCCANDTIRNNSFEEIRQSDGMWSFPNIQLIRNRKVPITRGHRKVADRPRRRIKRLVACALMCASTYQALILLLPSRFATRLHR